MPIFRNTNSRKLFYFLSPILYVNGSATSRILRHCWLLAPPPPITMPALLERPKLSNAMARALHKHIMRERERRRQEEEEVDKMMEQKMKEEEERKRKKEMEERMSLEETKEQIMKMGGKLQGLQEEKHQLFLQLKKVLHEEEKRRRKEQSDMPTLTSASYQTSMPIHSGQHLLSMQGSPVSHGRTGVLLGDRSKQLFQAPVIPVRHFQGQPAFSTGSSEHGQYSASQSAHGPYGVSQQQHASPYAAAQSVPVSFASSSQLRGGPAFQTMQYLPHQQQGYAVHSHFASQTGFIPSASIPLQKQLEHANQQSGFTDSSGLPYGHPPQPASPGGFSHSTSPQQAHAAMKTPSRLASCDGPVFAFFCRPRSRAPPSPHLAMLISRTRRRRPGSTTTASSHRSRWAAFLSDGMMLPASCG
ncbi:G protein pathway suppressor 2-like isoform X2 [Brienomyrus brachyistius]|uniref:G protein pathway suppressor 2-like isoform X2 n=1 Tax=Brienomyrus brachyistius TaxID=42636 RepID=UPI0020B2318A|nr:G protein pathway suppressor 2-like isoform X2 [Brienomyrus brachyistius]